MKKLLLLTLSIIFLSACLFTLPACKKEEGLKEISFSHFVSTSSPFVKWEGRYDTTIGDDENPSKINLYHTASGFTVDFTGTELYVQFESTLKNSGNYAYYNVAVDDEVIPTVNPDRTFYLSGGTEKIAVVKGLEEGRHTVKCLKMSEPSDALTSIVKMETDGSFIERNVEDDNAGLRFMFVCASGGSGFGSLAYSDDGKGSMGRNTKNSSSLHAFNYLTARMFGADVQFVATSGWGVSYPTNKSIYDILDYSGNTTANNVNGAKTTALWDYSKWVPQVIIFNIGGNDTTQNNFSQTVYENEVVAMVKKLHEKYPQARMIWTHTNSNAGRYAVNAMTDAGIMSAGYMKVTIIPKVGADGTVGASNHNSLVTHIETAGILADALKTNWGYNKIYDNVEFSDYLDKLTLF